MLVVRRKTRAYACSRVNKVVADKADGWVMARAAQESRWFVRQSVRGRVSDTEAPLSEEDLDSVTLAQDRLRLAAFRGPTLGRWRNAGLEPQP